MQQWHSMQAGETCECFCLFGLTLEKVSVAGVRHSPLYLSFLTPPPLPPPFSLPVPQQLRLCPSLSKVHSLLSALPFLSYILSTPFPHPSCPHRWTTPLLLKMFTPSFGGNRCHSARLRGSHAGHVNPRAPTKQKSCLFHHHIDLGMLFKSTENNTLNKQAWMRSRLAVADCFKNTVPIPQVQVLILFGLNVLSLF